MTFYGSLAGATAYHEAVGNTVWLDSGYDPVAWTAALTRGSRSLDGRYGKQFSGVKAGGYSQELQWPRIGAYDSCSMMDIPDDHIPLSIERAVYELALIEIQFPGTTSPTINLGRLTKSESVDGAASRSFFSPAEMAIMGDVIDGFRPTITVVSDLLGCFLKNRNYWSAVVV